MLLLVILLWKRLLLTTQTWRKLTLQFVIRKYVLFHITSSLIFFNLVVQHLMVCCPYLHLRGNHLWQLHQGSLLSPQEDLHHHQILHNSEGRNRCPAAILTRRYSPKFLSWHLSGMKQAHLESMWELDCGVLLQGKGLWHALK